jgi:hypothetical protein
MADLLLASFNFIEAFIIAMGVIMAYRIARMGTHAPLGWWLLEVSFALGLVRALLFLGANFAGNGMASGLNFSAMVITLPLVIFLFTGIYKFYLDFKEQLETMQRLPSVESSPVA